METEATISLKCIICDKEIDNEKKPKTFNDQTWATVKNAAASRKRMKSDKYREATSRIAGGVTGQDRGYHSSCYRVYTAVKRTRTETEETEQQTHESVNKKSRTETRRVSLLPKSDEQGLLKGKCIFCGKARKKKKNSEEPRLRISTLDGCQTLADRAKFSRNERIKSLVRTGVDLIAKEAEYHKSCRAAFYLETDNRCSETSKEKSSTHCHRQAFSSLCAHIENEVIGQKRPHLTSSLLEYYKLEYTSNGGNVLDVEEYRVQNLQRKVCDHFGTRITVKTADVRRGNFIYSSTLTEEEARATLNARKQEEDDKLKWAALHLRSLITAMPKSKTPNPTTVQNLKDSAPTIPEQLDKFFRSLLGGAKAPDFTANSKNADFERKVTSMASDAIYNVAHGTVKPWKQTAMGLGLSSLTGSKLSLQILNRAGHSISYHETKGLETEFAYSVESDERDTPDGIRLVPNRATASVWDNNDANIETLDGKQTLHATVGHTYQNDEDSDGDDQRTVNFRADKNRRRFVGSQRDIPPFRQSLKTANFASISSEEPVSGANCTGVKPKNIMGKVLDLYWLTKVKEGNTPLHAGFMSQFVKDHLPMQKICYMDPISRSPTNNDVVRETMVRTLNVAAETGQEYAVVTYDLAVALKAYSIQQIERPIFDKLLIMLGNFHIELAFYGAVGTMIAESGMEFILTEAEILAEGSVVGFIKGKFYNRCTRIHEIVATVLESKLYERFLRDVPEDEYDAIATTMNSIPDEPSEVEAFLSNDEVNKHLQSYENFFHSVMDGNLGPTAQFWAIYIYLINRLHREVQCCVKTNDVRGYLDAFPSMLAVFFGLNRPNYARWGTLFMQKLRNADERFIEVLEKGAFSIRRTQKHFSRSAVDLSLEQTVNRDAASSLRGIVAFRNSEYAMRRWHLTMTQRAMAVTELRTFAGLDVGETAATQCRPSRIRKDQHHMRVLSAKIDEYCNPFADNVPNSLVNLASGQAASATTEAYLLNSMQRGEDAMMKFQEEWEQNSSRFLKPIKRVKVQNFAAENVKRRQPKKKNATEKAESLRDMFIRMMVVAAEKTAFNLKAVLCYPITSYPLSLAHSDGGNLKTDKSALMGKLELSQTEPTVTLPEVYSNVYDGGLLIHSTLSQMNAGTSYSSIARTILSVVCSGKGSEEVHVCLDKYVENSIKDSERQLRGAVNTAYSITGPDQKIRQSGQKLLANSSFKNELGKFLLHEWGKNHYMNMMNGKTVIISYGGDCLQYSPDHSTQQITQSRPVHLQGDHEEADTLIAFHIANITSSTIIVRASDTDVLVILIGLLGKQRREARPQIIFDCGSGNNRRYINVNNVADVLEEKNEGLAQALPGYHAFTGCDFTSAFYR